jgi:hypothetical protein
MTTTDHCLVISASLFARLIDELASRGAGVRESGAFLLTQSADSTPAEKMPTAVTAIAYYDDLDPACLTGGITFSADGYTALGVICRRDVLRVVADIHTHPASWVDQSGIDAAHPMVALPGHIAIIAPRYARQPLALSDLGAHVFGGKGQWTSYFGPDVNRVLHVTETPASPSGAAALRQYARTLGRRLSRVLAFGRPR